MCVGGSDYVYLNSSHNFVCSDRLNVRLSAVVNDHFQTSYFSVVKKKKAYFFSIKTITENNLKDHEGQSAPSGSTQE